MDGPLFFWSFLRFYGDAHPRGSFSVGHDPRVLAQGTRLYVADAHPAGVFLVRLASDARDRRRHPRRGTLIEVASTCPSKRADDVDRAVHLGCIRRREDAILSWSRVMEEVLQWWAQSGASNFAASSNESPIGCDIAPNESRCATEMRFCHGRHALRRYSTYRVRSSRGLRPPNLISWYAR
jgi:hypothetical protein